MADQCTALFVFISKSVTSELSIEAQGADCGVVEYESSSSMTWDACWKYLGGAERTEWESLLVMESMDLNGGQLSNGVMMLVVALELSVVWHLAIFFGSAQRVV